MSSDGRLQEFILVGFIVVAMRPPYIQTQVVIVSFRGGLMVMDNMLGHKKKAKIVFVVVEENKLVAISIFQ